LNLKRTVRTRLVRQCSTRHRVFACIRVAACHWPLRAHLYVPTTSERSSRQSTVRQTDIAYTVICTLFYKVQAFLLRFGSAFFEFVFDFDHFLITEDNAHNRVWLHSRSCGCIDPTSRALYKLPHHNSGGPANLGRVACSVTNLSLALPKSAALRPRGSKALTLYRRDVRAPGLIGDLRIGMIMFMSSSRVRCGGSESRVWHWISVLANPEPLTSPAGLMTAP
jgi:hypothetical protein